MTITELKAKLDQFDPDTEVFVAVHQTHQTNSRFYRAVPVTEVQRGLSRDEIRPGDVPSVVLFPRLEEDLR